MNNIKMFKTFAVAALALISFYSFAQSADDIMAKNIEAMGGKEKLTSLKSVKMTGSMSVQGTDIALTITKSQGAGMRMDMDIMGTSNYQLANTTKGSVFMPIMGMASPQAMTDDQFQSAASQFDLQGPFLNYKDKGNTVVATGTDKVDGNDANKLDVTFKNGKKATYFIDVKTNRVVKVLTTESVNGEDTPTEATYSDYKQNADGYWFPYTLTNSRGTISLSTVDTNIKVDDSMFKD